MRLILGVFSVFLHFQVPIFRNLLTNATTNGIFLLIKVFRKEAKNDS